MNEQPHEQNPSQTPPPPGPSKDPGQEKPSDPCKETKPPEKKPEPKPDCPAKESCPEPKPCPDPPKRPPDPCDEKPAEPCDGEPQSSEPSGGGEQTQKPPSGGSEQTQRATPTQGSGSGGGAGGAEHAAGSTNGGRPSPAQHLEELRAQLEDRQKKVQELEPMKAELADLLQRIQAFEKVVDGQSASETAYKEFYRATQLAASDLECFIKTARCQLEISDKARKCVCDAIARIDDKVEKAKNASCAQKKVVEQFEAAARRAARDLEWTKRWYEFLKSGLQQQVTKQRDDLKALKGLVTPAANPCDAYFHLYELERLTQSQYGIVDEACWKDIWVTTFLDCWPWENYQKAWDRVLVEFNQAEAAEKLAKSRLEQAKKLAADLDKAAAEAVSKRREWILKEIKAQDCCGPQSKCP